MGINNSAFSIKALDTWALKQGWIMPMAYDLAYPELRGQPRSINARGKHFELVIGRGAEPVRVSQEEAKAMFNTWRRARFNVNEQASLTLAENPEVSSCLICSRWVAHGAASYRSIKAVRPLYHRQVTALGGATISGNGLEYYITDMPPAGVVVITDLSETNPDVRFATVITKSR